MKLEMRGTRGTKGYTMIELLTVLVLVGIIASLAAPSMTAYVTRSKTRRALDLVSNDIALARMAAVRSGGQSAIDFSGTDGYTVELGTDPVTVIKRVDLGDDYRGVSLTPPTQDRRLVFDSRGLLQTSDPGPIVARSGTAADSVLITAAGRAYRDY